MRYIYQQTFHRAFHYRVALCLLLLGTAHLASAQEMNVSVTGLFPPSKVLLTIDGQPKVVAAGSTFNGVKVVSVEETGATLEFGGRKQFVPMGSHYAAIAGHDQESANAKSITLAADARGHFAVSGTINGGHMQFLVDTGASFISIGMQDAKRLGLDLKNATVVYMSTANGTIPAYKIRLAEVNIEGIVLYGIDAVVHDNMQGFALLGMSFLNRMEMKRNGQTMTLTKRY